jgi:hypothetical protein
MAHPSDKPDLERRAGSNLSAWLANVELKNPASRTQRDGCGTKE